MPNSFIMWLINIDQSEVGSDLEWSARGMHKKHPCELAAQVCIFDKLRSTGSISYKHIRAAGFYTFHIYFTILVKNS